MNNKMHNILKKKWLKVFLGTEIAVAIVALIIPFAMTFAQGFKTENGSPTSQANRFLGAVRAPNIGDAYGNYLSSQAQQAFGSQIGFQQYLDGLWLADVTQSGPKIKANVSSLTNPLENIQGNSAIVTGTLTYNISGYADISAKFLLINEGGWKILTIQIPGAPMPN